MRESLIRSTTRIHNVLFVILFLGSLILQMEVSLYTDDSSYDDTGMRKHIPKLTGNGEDIIDLHVTIIDENIIRSSSFSKPNLPVKSENDFVKKAISETLVDHDLISINGNTDFINQASLEGWPGNGTENNPYLIENLTINGSLVPWMYLLDIKNTDLHFKISNCSIYGGENGLFLDNVTNAEISYNNVTNSRQGIYLYDSSDILLNNNVVAYTNLSGITLNKLNNSEIIANDLFKNNLGRNGNWGGLVVSGSHFNNVTNNYIYTNYGQGITLQGKSSNNWISQNYIFSNEGNGVYFWDSSNNTLSNNSVYNNTGIGFFVWTGSNNTIFNNNISENSYGIDISGYNDDRYYPRHNLVSNNNLTNNSLYDLILRMYSGNNTIFLNNFLGVPKIEDNGVNNSFFNNHWSDWISPDMDGNLVVDNPYLIPGSANNQDPYPHVFPVQTVQHDPILIYGNSDLINQANIEEWCGNGSFSNPYIISNYYFNSPSGILTHIVNVDLYFQIKNCIFRGGDISIYLINSKNGYVYNNIINQPNMWGVGIRINGQVGGLSNNIIINNNIIKGTGDGILLESGSTNIIIKNNTIFDCTKYGVVIKDSNDISGINNTIYNNNYGILVIGSDNVTISSNKVYNNLVIGIESQDSSQIEVLNNFVFNNSETGICLFSSASDNRILNNSIYYNYRGIKLNTGNNNIISGNIIHHNTRYGVYITGDATNASIKFNNLINNEPHQAYDEGGRNITFAFNYWNDWVSPDENFDGIVDNPVLIDGPSSNYDNYPLTTLTEAPIHLLLKPSILNLNGGEILFGNITIEWTQSVDSLGHTITFSIYHSSDGGNLWIVIDEDLTITTLNWETTTVSDDSNYLIKIVVNCSEGLTAETILVDSFTIDNIAPDIVLINPQNDTTLISLDTIELSITDYSLENVWYNWDDGMNQSLASPYQIDVPTEEGYHWLTVYATDFVGHITVQKYRWFILIPTTTTTATTSTTRSISTPSTITIESTTTSISAPKITPALNLFPFLMGLLVIVAVLRRLRR